MLHLVLYGLLAVILAGGLFLVASRFLPAGEQIAPALRDEPLWDMGDRVLAPEDVDSVRLPVALRGYRFAETDSLLDRLAAELRSRDAEIARLRGDTAELAPAPPVPVDLVKAPAPAEWAAVGLHEVDIEQVEVAEPWAPTGAPDLATGPIEVGDSAEPAEPADLPAPPRLVAGAGRRRRRRGRVVAPPPELEPVATAAPEWPSEPAGAPEQIAAVEPVEPPDPDDHVEPADSAKSVSPESPESTDAIVSSGTGEQSAAADVPEPAERPGTDRRRLRRRRGKVVEVPAMPAAAAERAGDVAGGTPPQPTVLQDPDASVETAELAESFQVAQRAGVAHGTDSDGPAEQAGIGEAVGLASSAEVEPGELAEPAEAVQSVGFGEPVDEPDPLPARRGRRRRGRVVAAPARRKHAAEPVQAPEPAEPQDSAQLVESVESLEPIESGEPAGFSDPPVGVEPVARGETAHDVEPVGVEAPQSADAADAAEPTEPTEPTEVVARDELPEPVEVGEPDAPPARRGGRWRGRVLGALAGRKHAAEPMQASEPVEAPGLRWGRRVGRACARGRACRSD